MKKLVSCLPLANKALKLCPFQLSCEHAALQWNPCALRKKCCSGVAISGSSRNVNCPMSQTGEAQHNIPALVTFHFKIWRQLWIFILVFSDQDVREKKMLIFQLPNTRNSFCLGALCPKLCGCEHWCCEFGWDEHCKNPFQPLISRIFSHNFFLYFVQFKAHTSGIAIP